MLFGSGIVAKGCMRLCTSRAQASGTCPSGRVLGQSGKARRLAPFVSEDFRLCGTLSIGCYGPVIDYYAVGGLSHI